VTRPRSSVLAAIGLALLGLAACSDGGSDTSSGSTSTLVTIVTTASSTTVNPSATTTTTTPFAPGQSATATTAGGGAPTTAAGRVVSKPSDNVRLGDSGPGVKQIQTALVAHGYKVATDGAFGPQTSAAVKAFQKQSGITQDGIVGPVTWAKLQAPATTTTVAKTTTTTAKA
jgi:peptidoglycan hydrolase-like protein with peptidoglycan-binding domain